MAFTGRICTVTPPGAFLEVVLVGVALAERDGETGITAETRVPEGVKVNPPHPPPPRHT